MFGPECKMNPPGIWIELALIDPVPPLVVNQWTRFLLGAIGAACTFVVLRKMGKSVHYYLSVWYYAVIGLIECLIVLLALGEWTVPSCGRDRWVLMLIAVLGIAGQTFLTKALQIEKAGPVALMRTMDVVLAFIFQFLFFDQVPSWWSLGGALCVVVSTSGVALRRWYSSVRRNGAGSIKSIR